jgi:hypothetical protein
MQPSSGRSKWWQSFRAPDAGSEVYNSQIFVAGEDERHGGAAEAATLHKQPRMARNEGGIGRAPGRTRRPCGGEFERRIELLAGAGERNRGQQLAGGVLDLEGGGARAGGGGGEQC